MCSSGPETPVTPEKAAEPAIRVTGLSKKYRIYHKPSHKLAEAVWNTLSHRKKALSREFWALRDVNLKVPRGATMGIVGCNGSGKSTLLQIIAGVLQPTSGHVQVHGRVAALLELGAGFNREFTGRENVFLQGAVMGIPKKEIGRRISEIEAFADIGEFIDQPVKTYSSGMYVRLAFAVAINVDADILIIDEALAVGDDMFRRRCYRRLNELQQVGKTILFVTHSMQTIVNLCTHAVLMDSGKAIFSGEPKAVVYQYNELLAKLEGGKYANQKLAVTKSRMIEDDEGEGSLSEHRYGNGGSELVTVEVENDEGSPVRVLNAGDHFTVRLQIRFRRATVEPNIGFSIMTLKGIEVHGTSTHLAGKCIGAVSQGEVITVRFRQRNLLGPDAYSVSAAVAEIIDGDRIFQDRRHDVISFKVVGNRRTYGLVDLESEIDTQRSV